QIEGDANAERSRGPEIAVELHHSAFPRRPPKRGRRLRPMITATSLLQQILSALSEMARSRKRGGNPMRWDAGEVLHVGNAETTHPSGLVGTWPERATPSQRARLGKTFLVMAIAAAAVGVTISTGVEGQDRTDLQITVSGDRLLNAQNELQNW